MARLGRGSEKLGGNLKALLVALLLPVVTNAAHFTTSQSGGWNRGPTWGSVTDPGTAGVDFPGTLDDVTITTASVINVPGDFNLDAGSITVNAGTTFAGRTRLIIASRGGFWLGTGGMKMGITGSGHASLELSSGAVFHLNSQNVVMSAGGISTNYLQFLGDPSVAGGSITVNGGDFGSFTQGVQGGFNNLHATWTAVNFTSMGAVGLSYGSNPTGFAMSSCTWVNSKRLQTPQDQADVMAYRYIEYSDFRGCADTMCVRMRGGVVGAVPRGRNEIFHNTFSSETSVGSAGTIFEVDAPSISIRENVFKNYSIQHVGSFARDIFFDRNLVVSTVTVVGTSFLIFNGSVTATNNYIYSEGDNPHQFQQATSIARTTWTVTDNVIETNTQAASPTDDGDIFLFPTATISSGVFLRNLGIGTRTNSFMLSMQGAAASVSSAAVMDNNTIYYDSATSVSNGCFRIGETYAGRDNMFGSLRNNICTSNLNDIAGSILKDNQPSLGLGPQKVSTADFNGYYNISSTLYQGTGTYGVNDTSGAVNPNFVDASRNYGKFGTSIGQASTSSFITTLGFLNLNQGSTYNQAYNIDALNRYVFRGFMPQAMGYKRKGFDASDLGAVPIRPRSMWGGF